MKNSKEEKKSAFRKNAEGKKVIGPNDELSPEMLREYAKAMHKAQKEGKRARVTINKYRCGIMSNHSSFF